MDFDDYDSEDEYINRQKASEIIQFLWAMAVIDNFSLPVI